MSITFLRKKLSVILLLCAVSAQAEAAEPPVCCAADRFFVEQVWARVGERTCLKCHKIGGDAEDSGFVLTETIRNRNGLPQNLAAFLKVATKKKDGQSLLVLKIAGDADHGGGEVLKADSTGYRILDRFVKRLGGTPAPRDVATEEYYDAPPFFEGVTMMSPVQLLRRVTLSLGGRLPTQAEKNAVNKEGLAALDRILEASSRRSPFLSVRSRFRANTPSRACSYRTGWKRKCPTDVVDATIVSLRR